jgi:hypothetical protein
VIRIPETLTDKLTIHDGFYITDERHGIRVSRRARTYYEAVESLGMMKEDQIVDLPRVRYYFNPDKILILRKANHTNKKYKCPYKGI